MRQGQSQTQTQSTAPEVANFLATLRHEISAGMIELPGFPDVSLQVQRLLSDDHVSTDRVVRLVGAEPVLAGRIMQLANSAALNPSGPAITELRTAVSRLGFDSLRAAAVAFAMTQLRLAPAYKHVEKSMMQLWHDNVLMASTACVVARRSQRLSPDTALFAGLMSGVGKICLVARGSAVPELCADPAAFHGIVRDWHAEVAKALLASWNVAEEIVNAVHAYERQSTMTRGQSTLTDVLAVSELLSFHQEMPEQIFEALRNSKAAVRLRLSTDVCVALIEESQAELAALRSALGQ